MNKIKIYRKNCSSIFRLIGNDENALTFALGYVFSIKKELLIDFLKEVGFLKKVRGKNYLNEFNDYSIHLQQYNDNKSGIKDLVVEDNISTRFKIIIEAKTDNSIPSSAQIDKYTNETFNLDLTKYEAKAIILLTRKIIPLDTFKEIKEDLNTRKIDLLIVSWAQIYKLIYKYRYIKSDNYKDRIIYELNKFFMEDYKIKHFEYEVLYRKVLKDYYENICNYGDRGFYFDGGRTNFIYPSCLYFLACYGPARSSKKTGQYLRKIDKYYISSANKILNSDDNQLKNAFEKHLEKFAMDSSSERIHVFELGGKIKVPESNINFNGSEIGYKELIEILHD